MAYVEFILVDGEKVPVKNLTITVNGTELPTTEIVCDVLPDPDDPYGTKWYALMLWLYGVMYYPWLFRN